jgi:peptidoglycan/LPS O-acetylase OafA/YrhL
MEGLRGYAVLLILCVHIVSPVYRLIFGEAFKATSPENTSSLSIIIGTYFQRSHYGVDLFFLLSGFLVFRIMERQGFQYHRFLVNRFFRIYPCFVVTTLIAIYLFCYRQGRIEFTWTLLLQNLLLLNGIPGSKIEPFNYVTWSLLYEFVFYVVAPVFIALNWKTSRFARSTGIIIWGATFTSVCFFSEVHGTYFRAAMFLFGCLMGSFSNQQLELAGKKISRFDPVLILVYLIAAGYVSLYVFNPRIIIAFYSVPCFFLVLSAIFGEGWLNQLFASRPMRYLGNISFSFYLFHPLALYATNSFIINPINISGVPGAVIFVITGFLVAFIGSTILFLLVEKPYFSSKATK